MVGLIIIGQRDYRELPDSDEDYGSILETLELFQTCTYTFRYLNVLLLVTYSMVNVYQATLVVFIVEDTKTTFRFRNECCEIATKDIRRAMEHNNHNRNESIRQRQPTSYCYSEGSLEPHGWKAEAHILSFISVGCSCSRGPSTRAIAFEQPLRLRYD